MKLEAKSRLKAAPEHANLNALIKDFLLGVANQTASYEEKIPLVLGSLRSKFGLTGIDAAEELLVQNKGSKFYQRCLHLDKTLPKPMPQILDAILASIDSMKDWD